MRARLILGLVVGAALALALFRAFGTNSIGRAFGALGWIGLAAIVAFHLGLIALMGIAWRILLRDRADARAWRFIWGRLVRDSASQALPLPQVGGMVLGVRSVAAAGVSPAFATASLIVDLGIETAGLVIYALIGLGLLCWLRPAGSVVRPIAIGVGCMAALAFAFLALQVRGSHVLGTWFARLASRWSGGRAAQAFALPAAIREIHAGYASLMLAWFLHLACWLLTGVQLWVTLRLMDLPIGFARAVVIDSLAFAMRSVAFVVPSGLGVQEGAFVLLGGLFGIGAQSALALSLIRRARDLVIAVPVLAVWQLHEGGRFWRRQPAEAAGGTDAAPVPTPTQGDTA